jgi:hypothetical protein
MVNNCNDSNTFPLIFFLPIFRHSKVTRTTNEAKTKLNRWTSQMRRLHQKTVNGEKFGLSNEKIKLLKKLDFIFEFDDLPERFSFHERYQWLLKFKEEHGTFALSRGYIK